jgi:hypothetical protein
MMTPHPLIDRAFPDWWRAVNDALMNEDGDSLPSYHQGRSWWRAGLSVTDAVVRHLDNENSSQEERSAYDAG